MAPLGCHASSATLRACKDAHLTTNPPSLASNSGKGNLHILAALFTKGLPTFQLGSDTFSAATNPSNPSKRDVMPGMAMSYDKDKDTIKNTPSPFSNVEGAQIAIFVAIGVVASIQASAIILGNIRHWLSKEGEKDSHSAKHPRLGVPQPGPRQQKLTLEEAQEVARPQEVVCPQDQGRGGGARGQGGAKGEVGLGWKKGVLSGEKKEAADVEALEGVTIGPMPV